MRETILGIALVIHVSWILLATYVTIMTYQGKADKFLVHRYAIPLAKSIMQPLWPLFAATVVIAFLSCLQVIFLASDWSLILSLCAFLIIIWLLGRAQQAIMAQLPTATSAQSHLAASCESVEACSIPAASRGNSSSVENLDCASCSHLCAFAGLHAHNTQTTHTSITEHMGDQ